MTLRQVLAALSTLWLLLLQTDGLLCARALTLIRLDVAPDISRTYRALPIDSHGDLDQTAPTKTSTET